MSMRIVIAAVRPDDISGSINRVWDVHIRGFQCCSRADLTRLFINPSASTHEHVIGGDIPSSRDLLGGPLQGAAPGVIKYVYSGQI